MAGVVTSEAAATDHRPTETFCLGNFLIKLSGTLLDEDVVDDDGAEEK